MLPEHYTFVVSTSEVKQKRAFKELAEKKLWSDIVSNQNIAKLNLPLDFTFNKINKKEASFFGFTLYFNALDNEIILTLNNIRHSPLGYRSLIWTSMVVFYCIFSHLKKTKNNIVLFFWHIDLKSVVLNSILFYATKKSWLDCILLSFLGYKSLKNPNGCSECLFLVRKLACQVTFVLTFCLTAIKQQMQHFLTKTKM